MITEKQQLIARVETSVKAPVHKVWHALTDPEMIRQYMFGSTVESNWKEGADITWRGEWKGKEFEDKGTILAMDENKFLQYSHVSGMSEKQAEHIVSIQLIPHDKQTQVILEQDNNHSEEEKVHAEKNWQTMLDGMKKLLEEQ